MLPCLKHVSSGMGGWSMLLLLLTCLPGLWLSLKTGSNLTFYYYLRQEIL